MSVFMFPGQGSQFVGMGKELFEKYPHVVAMADDYLGYSIQQLCLNGPFEKLNDTQYTQPAIYIVNYLYYLDYITATKQLPKVVLGHSLGEFSALCAASVFSFMEGLDIVSKRAEIMARAGAGSMAAVVGLSEARIEKVLLESKLETIDIANLNAPEQTIISGPVKDINAAERLFNQEETLKAYVILPVSGAFHSRYMLSAKEEFYSFLQSYTFAKPKTVVIANTTAAPHQYKNLKSELAEQLVSPVRWAESVRTVTQFHKPTEFVELGPGDVLSKLLTQIVEYQSDTVS